MNQTSWCYDLRSGWSEIEDLVGPGLEDSPGNENDALISAGFEPSSRFTLGEPDSGIHLAVHARIAPGPGPQYYIGVDFPSHWDTLYAANLPSLLAVLRDFAPILQSGFLHALTRGDYPSILELFKGALKKAA